MKKLVPVAFLLISICTYAQDPKDEINKQVWKVFVEAYNNFDTEKFMSVYSKDIMRVAQDDKKIFNFTEYRRNVHRENQFNKNYGIKAKIELRFIERIYAGDQAYEKGVFKIDLTDNNGKPATIFSKFEVVLKKEAGIWKIKFDTDSTEGATVSQKDFDKGKPM
jgi:ketosteroid isomerase-like protein